MITWTKKNGKWAARGPICEFRCANRYVTVTSKDGRETLCRITGTIPAYTTDTLSDFDEPTEAQLNRIVTVEVERETRLIWEVMREVRHF